jgi:hypothetical protein
MGFLEDFQWPFVKLERPCRRRGLGVTAQSPQRRAEPTGPEEGAKAWLEEPRAPALLLQQLHGLLDLAKGVNPEEVEDIGQCSYSVG